MYQGFRNVSHLERFFFVVFCVQFFKFLAWISQRQNLENIQFWRRKIPNRSKNNLYSIHTNELIFFNFQLDLQEYLLFWNQTKMAKVGILDSFLTLGMFRKLSCSISNSVIRYKRFEANFEPLIQFSNFWIQQFFPTPSLRICTNF